MKFQLLFAVFALAALTACDPIYGHGMVNRSSRPVNFVASFSGRHVEVNLEPKQAFWHRQPNLTLEALKVADGADTKDFSFIEIAAALSPVSTNRLAAVAYVGDGRIIGTTAELLRKWKCRTTARTGLLDDAQFTFRRLLARGQ